MNIIALARIIFFKWIATARDRNNRNEIAYIKRVSISFLDGNLIARTIRLFLTERRLTVDSLRDPKVQHRKKNPFTISSTSWYIIHITPLINICSIITQ